MSYKKTQSQCVKLGQKITASQIITIIMQVHFVSLNGMEYIDNDISSSYLPPIEYIDAFSLCGLLQSA